MKIQLKCLALIAGLLLMPAGGAFAQLGPGPFSAFPSESATDARFLGFGCAGLATLEEPVQISLSVPAGSADFTLSVFDGETGEQDSSSAAHWDVGNRQLIYSLYADPLLSADQSVLVGQWTGNDPNPLSGPGWTASATDMPDNDWWGVTITTSAAAQAPSGRFFYNLVIDLDGECAAGEQTEANVKLATSAPMTFLVPRFGLVAPLRQIFNDGPIVYPGEPFPPADINAAETTYDGTFSFSINVPGGATDLRIYDGDFDRGATGLLNGQPSGVALDPCPDTDDADTPNDYAGFPFNVSDATPEGAVTANTPADDNSIDLFRRGEAGDPGRVGCVRWELVDPNGVVYRNDNPSGDREWEQFRVTTESTADADYSATVAADGSTFVTGATLPAGAWTVNMIGLDLSNLNLWFAETCANRATGSGQAAACLEGGVYLVGDTVFFDTDGNGTQEAGDPGIPGVVLNLFDDSGSGFPVASRTTGDTSSPDWAECVANNTGVDESGLYCFGVLDPGDYTVQIDPSNFAPGGALEGLLSTTGGEVQIDNLVDVNVLTYDFGYEAFVPTVLVGDTVFRDLDNDGTQGAGEAGISGVLVEVFDSGNNSLGTFLTGDSSEPLWDVCADSNTGNDEDGLYCFEVPGEDTYTIVVDPSNFAPGGALEGLASTIGTDSLTFMIDDGDVLDFDFPYNTAAADVLVGDTVFMDSNRNGFQDPGEPGVTGVVLDLVNGGGTVMQTATTGDSGASQWASCQAANTGNDEDGLYCFEVAGNDTYTVEVAATNFGPGGALEGMASTTGGDSQTRAVAAADDLAFDYGYDADPFCPLPAEADPQYGSSGGHAIWLNADGDDFVFFPNPGSYSELPDGTATLSGTVRRTSLPSEGFVVDVTFTGRTATAPAGSPKQELDPSAYAENGGPVDTSTWVYYTGFSGTLAGIDDLAGAIVEIERTGPAYQVGFGANNKNLNFGGSGWFTWTVTNQPTSGRMITPTGQGDINIDLQPGECPECPPVIDFDTDAAGNPLAAGTVITNQWAAAGVQVTTDDPSDHPAMIFDSSSPTGGDWDLGSPNEDFGGPGIGSGGGAGAAGENAVALGKVLIISEDGDSSDPDDNYRGGTIIFTFDVPMAVDRLGILDIEESGSEVRAYNSSGSLVASAPMATPGNNSVQVVELDARFVSRLEVDFAGSGAVSSVSYCPETEDPPPAPVCSVEENFDHGASGWRTFGNCRTGTFVRGTPNFVENNGVVTQVDGDHTSGSGDALYTAYNVYDGKHDVDKGVCGLKSPEWSVAEDSELRLWYFHGQRDTGDDSSDYFKLKVSLDGGSSYSTAVFIGDVRTHAEWTEVVVPVPAGSDVRLKLKVSDGSYAGDLVEGGIDDVSICRAP